MGGSQVTSEEEQARSTNEMESKIICWEGGETAYQQNDLFYTACLLVVVAGFSPIPN